MFGLATILSVRRFLLARTDVGARPAAARPDFTAVYEAEFDYLWRSLRRLGIPAADLEDAAHEVFLVVHRRLGDYDPARPLRPWLFGIALRVAAARRRRLHPLADPDEEVVDPAPGPQTAAETRETRDLLIQGLSRLPLEQRAVVVLHDVDEVPIPEIAAALELPTNTAYSRLRLGRARLAVEVRRLRAREERNP